MVVGWGGGPRPFGDAEIGIAVLPGLLVEFAKEGLYRNDRLGALAVGGEAVERAGRRWIEECREG